MSDAGSDATVDVVLQTDDNEAFSSATSLGTLMTIPAVSPAGFKRVVPLPIGAGRLYERFIRLQFNVNNGPLLTGSFRAAIVMQGDSTPVYATAQPAGV
jgi:Bbp16